MSLRRALIALVVVLISFHPWVLEAARRLADPAGVLTIVVIFTYLVRPPVLAAQRWATLRLHRGPLTSLALAYGGVLLLGAAVLSALIPGLLAEGRALADNLPRAWEQATRLVEHYQSVVPAPVQEAFADAGTLTGNLLHRAVSSLSGLSGAVAWMAEVVLLVPLLTWYLLRDGPAMRQAMIDLLPALHRPRAEQVMDELHDTLERFERAKLSICVAVALLTGVALVPVLPEFCVVLGVIAGLAELIPVFGPLLAGVPAVLLALASRGWGPAVVVLLLYLAIQQVEAAFLTPRIMSATLELHPLSVLVSMLVFGNLFGVWGVLLAAPLVAALRVLLRHAGVEPQEAPPGR